MAIAEHEITQQLTLTLSGDLHEKMEQAALASGQTTGDFIVSSLKQVAEVILEPRSATPAFGGDPLDRISLERRAQEEAEGRGESETDIVLFTSHDGTTREVGALPPNLGHATAIAAQKAVSKIWGTHEEEAACHAMQKGI